MISQVVGVVQFTQRTVRSFVPNFNPLRPNRHHPSLATREIWLTDQIIPRLTGATRTLINVGWFADNCFLVFKHMVQIVLDRVPQACSEVPLDRGELEHRQEVHGCLLVTRRDAAGVVQPADAAFHDVAALI